MKLFKIIVTHYAPKDINNAIHEYVVAQNDREIFEYLANGYAYWCDMLSDSCEDEYWEILEHKGDHREVYDLYYGATQYGWEEVELINSDVIGLMIENKLAKLIK